MPVTFYWACVALIIAANAAGGAYIAGVPLDPLWRLCKFFGALLGGLFALVLLLLILGGFITLLLAFGSSVALWFPQ